MNVRTSLVSSLYGFGDPTVFSGALYVSADHHLFSGCDPSISIYGKQLWCTGRTDSGTAIVKEFFTELKFDVPGIPGAQCWGSGATPSIVANDQLFFSASL